MSRLLAWLDGGNDPSSVIAKGKTAADLIDACEYVLDMLQWEDGAAAERAIGVVQEWLDLLHNDTERARSWHIMHGARIEDLVQEALPDRSGRLLSGPDLAAVARAVFKDSLRAKPEERTTTPPIPTAKRTGNRAAFAPAPAVVTQQDLYEEVA